jgi:[acyl-carrier-protein] S-malonyltransferase
MRTSPNARLAGERVSIPERMIVAPGNGVFRLTAITYSGAFVDEGDEIGVMESPGSSTVVRSPFAGTLMGVMAHEGERLRTGEPVAWLRVA